MGSRDRFQSLLLHDLFLFALLLLATRLAAFLHEVMGHALFSVLLGGGVRAIRLSLLGGGRVYYDPRADSEISSAFLVAFGGILVNVLTGLPAFLYARKERRKSKKGFFLILFSMVSLLGALAYLVLGFYYRQGDPLSWMGPEPGGRDWWWVPFFVMCPFVSYHVMGTYIGYSHQFFPAGNFRSRVRSAVCTLGLVGCAYAGVYEATGQSSVALDAPLLAYKQAEERIRQVKKEELARKMRKFSSELSEEEIQGVVESTRIVVRREEIPTKFPMKPVLAVFCAAGALFGLRNAKKEDVASPARISPKSLIFVLSLAGAVLGFLLYRDGWIYLTG